MLYVDVMKLKIGYFYQFVIDCIEFIGMKQQYFVYINKSILFFFIIILYFLFDILVIVYGRGG